MHRNRSSWRADNSAVFDSLVMPLAKALRAFQAETAPIRRGAGFDPKYHWASGRLYFPILLTTAPLYVVDADDRPYTAQPAKWVPLRRHIETINVKGTFRIQVVNAEFLDEYVNSEVIPLTEALVQKLRTDPELLTREQIPALSDDG
jgi:hypothetical protein